MSTKLMLACCKSQDAQIGVTALFFQLDLLRLQCPGSNFLGSGYKDTR